MPGIERGDPALGSHLTFAGEPARGARELQHGAALLRTLRFLEHGRRVRKPAELQKGEAPPEGMLFVGQLLEAARLEELVGIAHERKDADEPAREHAAHPRIVEQQTSALSPGACLNLP